MHQWWITICWINTIHRNRLLSHFETRDSVEIFEYITFPIKLILLDYFLNHACFQDQCQKIPKELIIFNEKIYSCKSEAIHHQVSEKTLKTCSKDIKKFFMDMQMCIDPKYIFIIKQQQNDSHSVWYFKWYEKMCHSYHKISCEKANIWPNHMKKIQDGLI